MLKAKKLVALAVCVAVAISAFFVCSFSFVKTDDSFRKSLSNIYQKYDNGIDKSLLANDEFALKRLVVLDYNGKDYGEIDSAVSKDGFAVLQFDSSNSARRAYNQIKEDGLTVDADGIAELSSYELGEMHPVGSEALGTKQFATRYKMGKENVTIAVIDTGVMLEHPDLKDRFIDSGYDFTADGCSNASYDTAMQGSIYFHGTLVSGILANNTMENVKLRPYKIVPFGASDLEVSALLAAISQAIDDEVDVINLSVSTYSSRDVLYKLVKRATDAGICVCSSAGNRGAAVDSCPASFNETITVGALNKSCTGIATFSCYGDAVDFVAPGSSIYSTMPTPDGAGYGKYSGTSFSTPYIAALCANIKTMNKSLTRNEVYQILCDFSVDMGDEGKDIYYGNGVPNLANMVYTDNESYEYKLPQGTLKVYDAKDYTESTQPWRLFREKLISVDIKGLENIGAYNFYGMKNAIFNSNVFNSVGEYAFYECYKMPNVVFPIDAKGIGSCAFKNVRTNFIISGYRNTPVEQYANNEKIAFNALGCKHNYAMEIIDPTDEVDGYTLYTCLVCRNEYIGEYIAPQPIAEGACGDDIEYILYNTGKLELIGSGDMWNCIDASPFDSIKSQVTSVYISKEIDSISPIAFAGCRYIGKFVSYSDEISVSNGAVYTDNGKTLLYVYQNEYEMPNEVEAFNPIAFVNSNIDLNDNFVVEDNIVYNKAGDIALALREYNAEALAISNEIKICDFAFILTDYPQNLRVYSDNLAIGSYGIGYSYKNGIVKNNFTYAGYDTTQAYEYATENGFETNLLNAGKCGDDLYWHYDLNTKQMHIYGTGDMYTYSMQSIPWYDYLYEIEEIIVDDGVKKLSGYSFFSAASSPALNVVAITVPASISVPASGNVWTGCRNASVKIVASTDAMPDYATTVKTSAYKNSPWYYSKNVSIDESIERIGGYSFRANSGLNDVVLNNCDEIGNYAFYDSSIKSLTCYKKDTLFGKYCFSKVSDNFVLRGYDDSTAKDYALANSIAFESIGCDHTRGFVSNGERAACCFNSDIEYHCVDCNMLMYNEYLDSIGNGHFVKANVKTDLGKPIQNANVYLDGELSAVTNEFGNFVLSEVKCESTHLVEIKQNGVTIASTEIVTNGANRQGRMSIHYGDYVKDKTINAKDYAYALKHNFVNIDILDYGKILEEDEVDISEKYTTQLSPRASKFTNTQNATTSYRRDFKAEIVKCEDYTVKEAGFIYGKNMDDDFITLENIRKTNASGFVLKQTISTKPDSYIFILPYGSASMDGKVSARFYYIYTNGVKDYVWYSDVSTFCYE